jgi:hypothetical protein
MLDSPAKVLVETHISVPSALINFDGIIGAYPP